MPPILATRQAAQPTTSAKRIPVRIFFPFECLRDYPAGMLDVGCKCEGWMMVKHCRVVNMAGLALEGGSSPC